MKKAKFILYSFSIYHVLLGLLYATRIIVNPEWDLSVWGILCTFISFLLFFCAWFAQKSLYFAVGTSLLVILTLSNEIQPLYAWVQYNHLGYEILHGISFVIGIIALIFIIGSRKK